jgi:hypothetical protein
MKLFKSAYTAALLALGLFSATVNATVMTQDFSESFKFKSNNKIFDYTVGKDANDVNYRTVVKDTQLLSMSRFDGSLGELLDVNIWFETEWNLGAVVYSQNKKSRRKSASGAGKSISRQAVRLIDPKKEVEVNREVLRTSCRSIRSCKDADSTSGQFNETFDLSSFTLSDFVGTDDIDFKIVRTLIADLTLCNTRDYCYQKNKKNAWGGTVFVSYTYDDSPNSANVPEPSTLALLGMGLLGLGASRLSRKKYG